MVRASSKEIIRSDDNPDNRVNHGTIMSETPMQPITNANDNDVKAQESSDAESKHNNNYNSEADRELYQFVEPSDCDGEDCSRRRSFSELSDGWEEVMEPFTFVTSTQVDFPVHVKICTLEGKQKPIPASVLLKSPELRHIPSNTDPNSDLYVTVQLWADSKPLGVPMQTAYKYFKNSRTWNEWLKMPMAIKDIPYTAQLAITIWDLSPFGKERTHDSRVPFGGTTIPLFDDEDGTLKKGRHKCKVYRHKGADGFSSTTTPSTPAPKRRNSQAAALETSPEEQELERLEGLLKKHEMGEIPRVDWLDQMVFKAIERAKRDAEAAAKRRTTLAQASKNKEGTKSGDESDEEPDEEFFFLYVEFPRFDLPIVFSDFEYPPPPISTHPQQTLSGSNATLKPPPEIRLGPDIEGGNDDGEDHRIIRIYDPEVGQKGNPCEDKHRRLVRSHRTGIVDRDLKPNSKYRDELNVIMSYGPTQELNAEEKDLVWKFRHHLTRDKRALTKFIKSVNWQDVGEATQAVELLPRWTEIDVDDALELLGPTFDNIAVRAYAVDRLRKADDEELLLYLLQLVQALKFEKVENEATEDATQDSSLAKFLISRAANNFTLGNYFHWYLMVECDDANPGSVSAHRKLFARVEYYFMAELEKTNPEHRKTLLRQGELITVISKISKDIRFSRDSRPMKISALKKCLHEPKNDVISIDPPLPLPLDPDVLVTGCFPEESNVFKSSLSPVLINFKTSEGHKYPFIFKFGDDLRQDQLVIQIISLMDRLLRKENLDLKLTPYRILATSSNAGAAQFIPSTSLSAACQKYKGSILAYLKANNPDDNEPFGVRKEVMDTYVKSCAGYCVITYLLGVGDRHLDNLLLAPDGHFFHADFGFILGRDPKPFAPMMKLCKEMVEGMGGATSPFYLQFKQYCFTVYTTLRKSANLILNLFSLMVDANIPDIRVEPDKAVLKVKERFHLEMSEEEAIRHFEQLINDSVNAIFGVMIDRLHDFVQGWRA